MNPHPAKDRWVPRPFVCAVTVALIASQRAPGQVPLDFDAARTRLQRVSDALAAADAGARGKRDLARATSQLRWPNITIDARELQYRKTLDLPVGTLGPVAKEFKLPSTLRFEQQEWRSRPSLTMAVPIYTGGRIGAAQHAAAAGVREALAARDAEAHSLDVQLVEAFFGQQLAERALTVRRDVRDGLQQHLAHAEALESEGFATRAQRLQAVVARDQAEREYQKAINDLATARTALQNLLHSDETVPTATPLFVVSTALLTAEEFRRDAVARHPQLARLRAVGDQARENVTVQRAELKPELFGFAQYDLYRQDALLTDADWAFGIGVRFQLLTGNGRIPRLQEAHEEVRQVDASLRDLVRRIELGVTRAYNDLATARSQFLLLESTIARAEENVRLQELSFREGEATSLDVIDARLSLGKARIDRAEAAYQFDLRLAQLLELSAQTDRFGEYARNADKVLAP